MAKHLQALSPRQKLFFPPQIIRMNVSVPHVIHPLLVCLFCHLPSSLPRILWSFDKTIIVQSNKLSSCGSDSCMCMSQYRCWAPPPPPRFFWKQLILTWAEKWLGRRICLSVQVINIFHIAWNIFLPLSEICAHTNEIKADFPSCRIN